MPGLQPRVGETIVTVTLCVRKTPDHKRRRGGLEGVTTGLPLSQFLHLLFFVNETLPYASKMTDEEIWRQTGLEYPQGFKTTKRHPTSHVSLTQFRKRYNQATLVKDVKPLLISHRWTLDGRMADGYGRPLTDEQIRETELRDREWLFEHGSPPLEMRCDGSLKKDRYAKVAVAGLGMIWPTSMSKDALRVCTKLITQAREEKITQKKQAKRVKRAVHKVTNPNYYKRNQKPSQEVSTLADSASPDVSCT